MKTSSEGFQQCYNAQVAVDGKHQLVVATDLTANASDQGGLPALLDDVAETFGRPTSCRKRHRHEEFLSFLRLIDREVPAELDIHLVLDNYATPRQGGA